MTLTTWILVAATVLGFALTAWGIIGAYRGAKQDLDDTDRRMKERAELETLEAEAHSAAGPGGDHQKIIDEFTERSRARGITRVTRDNVPQLPSIAAREVLASALNAARGNLITAGIGLLVSTLASLGSLFAT